MMDHSATHQAVVVHPDGHDYYCNACNKSGSELRTVVCSSYDHDIALQEQFAAALDKLIGDYSERGLSLRSVDVELINVIASHEGMN